MPGQGEEDVIKVRAVHRDVGDGRLVGGQPVQCAAQGGDAAVDRIFSAAFEAASAIGCMVAFVTPLDGAWNNALSPRPVLLTTPS